MTGTSRKRRSSLSLRARILLYLVAVHIVLGTVGLLVVIEDRQTLFLVEGLIILSVVIGFMLVRAFFVPLELIRTGAELITERDFTSHFREVGQPEMDALIAVYNRTIDRLREERLLLEEKNLFIERVVQATPAGIVILDFDGRIEHANPRAEQLLELHQGNTGVRLGELHHPLADRLATIDPGHSGIVSPDGWRRFRAHRGSFMDRGFSREFFLIEELTEELRASEKAAYEKLIRMMSHEVKNSVSAVRSLLESCRTYSKQIGPNDRSDFENALTVAIARIGNLNEFTDSFANVVRIPSPEHSRFDLERLLRDLLLLLEPEIVRREIRVAFESSGETWVEADKNQLEQVFMNILRNALESVEAAGVIDVTLDRAAGSVRATIGDSGPGIAPELEGRLFTPFLSTKRDGRGIGLMVIHEILSNHGLRFSLRNRPGRGAEFEIIFPAE